MPAIPIAESSAPMVVGIRQTRSAISLIGSCSCPAYKPIGPMATTARRKMTVNDASRMLSAISLGVF